MRSPRPDRREVRRDPALRTIRTNEVRYPGANLPSLPKDLEERYRAAMAAEAEQSLVAGVRDTGIAVESRLVRQQRAKRRSQQQTVAVTAAVVVGLLLVGIGWRSASDKRALTAPLGGGSSQASTQTPGFLSSLPAAGHAVAKVIARSSTPATAGPTPVFASYKDLKLRLPVRAKALTEVGFHQAAYGYALPMKTPLKDAKLASASNHRGTHRDVATQPTGPDAVLIGKVLRIWRPRPGKPDTAADIGAKPGTNVYAPVTGTVVKVKHYLLYGKWWDYEIHIRPDGYDDIDLVMIHVQDVTCAPGDRVNAGETRIAAVRKLSDKFYIQLASYTKGGGNHVHLQVNDATDPTYKGLDGAVDSQPEPIEDTPTLRPGVL